MSSQDAQIDENYEDQGSGATVVLGIVTALLVALLVRTVTGILPQRWHVLPLPYTAVLLLAGGVVGAVAANAPPVAFITEGLKQFESIAPSVLLSVFLPALITPSAIDLKWHVVRLTLDKAILLAVLGTLFNASIIAVLAKFMFPYDWSWAGCWLFAAVLAAIDPVAVVAIMHSTAASVKLATMIEGESLLNDGVAYVLFQIFIGWAAGGKVTAGNVVSFVIKSCLGSPSLGLAWAIGLTIWFLVLFSDPIAEIIASITASYALWLLSDEILDISGILALVTFGIGVSAFGIFRISHNAVDKFKSVWELIDWTADTIIFFLAGLIIAVELSEVQDLRAIQARDWGYAVALYLLLFFIRGSGILLLYPLLRLGLYGASWRDCIMLTWAGLRGALSLALSLTIYYSNDIQTEDFRQKQFFFVGFVTSATLLLQGSTTPLLLGKLGYLDLPPAKRDVMQRCAEAVEMLGVKGVRKAQMPHSLLGDADWERVQQLTHLGISHRLQHRPSGVDTRQTALEAETSRSNESETIVNPSVIISDLRERLMRALISQYHDALEADLVTPHEAHILITATEKALDSVQASLKDWEKVLLHLESVENLAKAEREYVKWWRHISLFIKGGRRRAGRDASIAAAFACAHAAARRELQAFVDLEFGGIESESEEKARPEQDDVVALTLECDRPLDFSEHHGSHHERRWRTDATASSNDLRTKHDEERVEGTHNSSIDRNPSSGREVHDDAGNFAPYAGDQLEPLWGERERKNPLLQATRGLHRRMPSIIRRVAISQRENVIELWFCLDKVLEESRSEQRHAEAYVMRLREWYPKAVRDVRTLHVAIEALRREEELLKRLKREGLLERRETTETLQLIDRRLKTMHYQVAFGQ